MSKIVTAEKFSKLNETHISSLIKGWILGLSFIIPGVSGGTVLVIFGIYDRLLSDILKFKLRSYLVFGIGTILGIFAGSYILTYLFENYRNPTSSFILGCVLMSIPFILRRSEKKAIGNIPLLVLGFVISFILLGFGGTIQKTHLSIWHVFYGGFISSSTMVIPGISGSSVLIVAGIYEQLLYSINNFDVKTILFYLGGALVGLLTVAKLMKLIFSKYESQILYFFSGMIMGSSKMLFPSRLDILSIVAFALGVSLVYECGRDKIKS